VGRARLHRLLVVAALGLGMLALVAGSSAATSPAVTWGGAVEVPGTAALNSGGDAGVASVSCAAAGACVAGGRYTDGSFHGQAFVVSETKGKWGGALEVPGTATLNDGGDARVDSVSCAAPGDCAAGGSYTDGSAHRQAFVVSETNGVWGEAVEVPGTTALNGGGDAVVDSVSCAEAGDCAVGGYYTDGSGHPQAYVAGETNGTWGNAIEVPGTAALNSGGSALVISISCAAAGDCAAGGQYSDDSGHGQAFVVGEKKFTWGEAIEVPGTAALNSGGSASVGSVSCTAAGACAAGGSYTNGFGHAQPFVVSEANRAWGDAVAAPGMTALDGGDDAYMFSLSCAAPGDCAAGGTYAGGGSDYYQAFVLSETNGTWGYAIKVPGTTALNTGGTAEVFAISCAAAGDCTAVGQYAAADVADDSTRGEALAVSETSGKWGNALEVPGTATLNSGGEAQVRSVSCPAADACTLGGYYKDGSLRSQAFAADSLSPCVVPKLVGQTLGAAKKRLTAAGCGRGRIKTVYAKARKGRVVAQSPKPGTHLGHGGKVALTLSKGKQ